jgi:hypothetical protein
MDDDFFVQGDLFGHCEETEGVHHVLCMVILIFFETAAYKLTAEYMLNIFTYHFGTPMADAFRAILASTRLVFILNGEANAFPASSRS